MAGNGATSDGGFDGKLAENNPIGSLFLDIFILFTKAKADRMFSRTLAQGLDSFVERPWAELRRGKEITGPLLARLLRPYGVRSKTMWIGEEAAKGYLMEDFREAFKRYIPRSEIDALGSEPKVEAGEQRSDVEGQNSEIREEERPEDGGKQADVGD